MAEQLLNRADIASRLEEMGRKRVPQGVTARILRNPARPERFLERALHHRLVHVVAAALTGLGILIHPPRRKHPLPCPLSARIRVLERSTPGQLDPHST